MRRILVESAFAPFWRELMEGITLYVREGGVPWQLYSVSPEEFRKFLAQRPDGVLCMYAADARQAIAAVKKSGVPAVNMMRNLFPAMPSVASDHEAIGREAAGYFLSRGFRHFAFVGVDRAWSDERLAGFRARLQESKRSLLQLDVPLANIDVRNVDDHSVARVLERWVASLPKSVAVFTAADYVARRVLEACRRAKIKVPEHVAVLGVDNDTSICEVGPVTLSSIPQNFLRIGFEAARLLDGMLGNRRKVRGPVWVSPREVVVRRSTDVIAVKNPHVSAALRYIHGTAAEALTMKQLLARVPLSRQWLDRLFKEEIGRTASEEMRRVKFARVRHLLLNSELSVSEIARATGFRQGENLTRFFRTHAGTSPQRFRLGDR
ncbi:MAG: substrate-binding domain-containing protein [Phycisphaerae bacterium]